jgi:hypothetical protein
MGSCSPERSRDRRDSEMSLPTTDSLPPDAPTSVFVDASGRRRARARTVARMLVAAAGIYVLVVLAGLTGSVSLPGVHLGELHRVAGGRAHSSPLGPGSKVLALPKGLGARPSAADGTPSATLTPGTFGATPGATSPVPGRSGSGVVPGTTSQTPGAGHRPTTTTRPASPTTTLPVTTTTKRHGPPTTTSHGPPSTTPGQGKGRTK